MSPMSDRTARDAGTSGIRHPGAPGGLTIIEANDYPTGTGIRRGFLPIRAPVDRKRKPMTAYRDAGEWEKVLPSR